ncbi:hypothetical protein Afil01_65950 [Actinorhabdospora filicis]|uniref:ABC transporter domain-containing protein n=1 Tax=Actinorhabdospora filicis TaxID=1785913 RepID=A0A9W6WD64_9ACTN|nr:hypothetical protein Afil01_65950 [Actinorhabdospora filicis]
MSGLTVGDALAGVCFRLGGGETVGVIGESGSGAHLLAPALLGLVPATGSVRFHGRDLTTVGDAGWSAIRGSGIAYVPAEPRGWLDPVRTVAEQVALALHAHQRTTRDKARRVATDLLAALGVPEPARAARAYPHELTTATAQCAAVAIAVANRPDVIVADDPTAALDVTSQGRLMDVVRGTGAALVLITRDLGVLAGHADRVVVLYGGRMVEGGTAEEVFYGPRMPYTLGLLGSVPRVDLPARRLPVVRTLHSRPLPTGHGPGDPLTGGCVFAARCPLAVRRCLDEAPALRHLGPSRVAACHFAERLDGVTARAVFG